VWRTVGVDIGESLLGPIQTGRDAVFPHTPNRGTTTSNHSTDAAFGAEYGKLEGTTG
jgi:hypothetical protein